MPRKGRRFHWLKVLGPAWPARGNRALCVCLCGNHTAVKVADLHRGMKSCGCFRNRPGRKSIKWTGFGEISGNYWYSIKRGARKRKISFDITIGQVWSLFLKQKRKCALTGLPLEFGSARKRGTASLDRINCVGPTGLVLGYTKSNVQWVDKRVNAMKSKMSQVEFVQWCKLVAEANK